MSTRITLSPAKSTKGVVVLLNNKVVGHIRQISEVGYKYFPKGSKTGGETFPSIATCYNSLLDEKNSS